jgi:hypothetical protein
MARLMSGANANATALYGDLNTQQASIVPDLGQINSQQLQTFVDTAVTNLNQTLKLNNTVYDTRNSWFNVQSYTNNALTIQGSFDGWTPSHTVFLQLAGKILYVNKQAVTFTNCQDFVDGWDAGELHWLNVFDQVRFYMGRNNIKIGRPSGEYCQVLKTSFLDNQYSEQEADVYGHLGYPYSILGQYGTDNQSNRVNNIIPIIKATQQSWANRVKSSLIDIAARAGSTAATADPIEVPIPLKALTSYAKTDQWFPPNLPIKLEISMKQGSIFLGSFNTGNIVAGSDPAQVNLYFVPDLGNSKLFYRSHLLNTDVQKQINDTWITKKFLTNYHTYEYQEYVGNSTNVVTMNITISQQRPLQLIMKVLPTNAPADNNGAFTLSTDSISPLHNFMWVNINIGGRNKIEYKNDYVTEIPQFGIRKCQSSINAIVNAMQYESKRDMSQSWPYNTSMENFYSNFGTSATQPSLLGSTINSGITMGAGTPLCFSINPGDLIDTNSFATDQGATTITIEANIVQFNVGTFRGDTITKSAMTSDYKLVVIKKYPEQLTLGQDLNVGLVQWPAVVTSPNQIYISNTFNNN